MQPTLAKMKGPLLALSILLLAVPAAFGQFTWTITEINPNQSTFDATDPDGASGGRVNSLGRAPNGTTFFAASEWGGIFRSTDTGRTWAHLDGHRPQVTIDVKVNPRSASRVYATSLFDGRVNSLSGINVSTDGGNTWNRPATAKPPTKFCASADRRKEPAAYGISVNPSNAKNVVIGTNCGVAISRDAGATWTFVDPTPNDAGADDVWDVVVHDGGIIDVCGNDGHLRSTDAGANWTTATSSPLPGGRCSISVSPDEAYVLFAVVGTTLFESDDAGDTWPNTFINPRAQGRVPFVSTNQRTGAAFDLWFGDVRLFSASCTTPAIQASGGVRRCPENTWSAPFTRTAGAHDDVGDIVFAPGVANDACPVLFSSDGGVYFNTLDTSPGCQSPAWEQPNVTPHALWLMGMGGADEAGAAIEDLYFGAQDNGPYAATDAPASPPTWNNRNCCDSFDTTADATRVLFTVCCFTGQNRMFSSGVGMTAIAGLPNTPAGNFSGFRYIDIVKRFAANSFVVVTTSGIFTTTDITANPIVWSQRGAASSPASPRGIELSTSGGTPSFLVQAGTADGMSQDQLWRFDGNGAGDWQQVNPPGGTGGFGIFAVDPNNPNRLIASHMQTDLDPRMVISTDGGANWTALAALDTLMTAGGVFRYRNATGLSHTGNAITQQVGYPQPTFAAFDQEDGNIIAAGGADSGVFVSIDGGANWTLLTDPINPSVSGTPHIPRPRFAFFDHEGSSFLNRRVDIYLGSQGRGVWRTRLTIPRLRVINICDRYPSICSVRTDFIRGMISIDCSTARAVPGVPVDCVFRDPVRKNCMLKYDCPGCLPTGLCPPTYRLYFDDLDIRVWDVTVLTTKDELVPFDLAPTKTGVVITFRPDKAHFASGSIGDYQLLFARKAGAKGTTYKFGARLEVGEKPWASAGVSRAPVKIR